MKRKKAWLRCVFLALIFVLFAAIGPYSSSGSTVNLDDLKKTNVALEFTGFAFGSGLQKDANGTPDCNGLELVQAKWAGSGFIVNRDGTFITNYHVARRASAGQAKFPDQSSFDIAAIKVYDSVNDLAVMQIKAQKTFSTVKLGNSDTVNVMDQVVAVGNAFDQGLAVTEGIINQVFVDSSNARYQFRHSATIAPGNSGGPLYKGNEVIAVNVSIVPGYSIYYSIPINLARPLLDPKFATGVLLSQAFPANVDAISQKAQQLWTQSGQVPAAASASSPGTQGYTMDVSPLDDILFELKCPGRDLALMAVDQETNTIIGLGDLRQADSDYLLLTPPDGTSKIAIYVVNSDQTPANFALVAYRIQW